MTDNPTTSRRSALSIGWGVIGASRMARQTMLNAIRHQPMLPQVPGVAPSWVMGVYSRSPVRARQFANEMQIAYAYESLGDLLRRPEISCIYVSTHPRYQAEMALTAIEAGKHVLCETPMGLTVEEAHRVQKRALQKDVLLAVNYALRAHPALIKIAALLREEAIGEILGARISNTEPLPFSQHTWRLEADGGGVILDRTIHDIDLLRWLLADEIDVASAMAGKPFLAEEGKEAVEEEILAALRMRRSGVAVQLHDSFTTLHQHSTLEIYGTGGTLIAYRWWGDWRSSELILVRNDEVINLPLDRVDPYQQVVAAFNEAVRRRNYGYRPSTLLAMGEEGVRNLQIALQLGKALHSGQTLQISKS
jgi:1,5-anhydro-D-fructose reductase (1,5-anhydro-D-mannitol-forming)